MKRTLTFLLVSLLMVSANFAAALNDVAVMQYNGTYYAPINVTAVNSGLFGLSSSGVMGFRTTLTGMVSISSTSFVGALTGNASTATALATGRTIAITGDGTYTSGAFDGTANVTGALTLSTVNANVGTFGSATQAPQLTVNAKGLITAASNVTITPAVGSITGLGTGVATALAVNVGTSGAFVVNSTTVNGHALTSNVTVTASDVSLGNVTNDAQTKASIVPNTVPTAGQLLVGNAGATAYAPVSMSGDVTINSAGATTIGNNKVNGFMISLASEVAGNIMYYDGTNWVHLANDTGKYLKSGGAAPSWDTPSGTGDMTKAVYDPQNAGFISGDDGASSGGVLKMGADAIQGGSPGGSIFTYGGSGANASGGYIITYGGATASASGGFIQTVGDVAPGGNINTYGGSVASAVGGNISTNGGTAANALGGNISTNGGGSPGANGGAIDTSGSTVAGGNITTSNGGGSISTTGVGSIQMGVTGTRTTLTGEATGNRTAKFPANSASGYIPLVASTTGIVNLSGSEVTGTATVGNGGTGVASMTAYAPLFGGTTTTGSVQSGTVGNSGEVLTSNGAGAIATFQAPALKAWVRFDGTSAADITTATYSRTLTTVTVTLNGHGYLTGHVVYIDFTSGGALDGVYTITGVATNTFTVTTAASGTIAAGSTMNLLRRTISASSGVHSVTYQNTVGRFYVNFSTAMSDANYAVTANAASGTVAAKIGGFGFAAPTAQSCDIWTSTLAGTLENEAYSSVVFTR